MPCGSQTRPTFKICRCACKWRCQCLIPRDRKSPPPFNRGEKRGIDIGLHPKFYLGKSSCPSGGLYEPIYRKPKDHAINWNKEVASAEFSATMGGRLLKEYVIQRDVMKRGRGPGTHEIPLWPDIVLDRRYKSIKDDTGLGTVPLFKPSWPSTTPGPGYTRKNPYYYIDKRRREGLSCVPTFEYDGGKPRIGIVKKSWTMPCNLYDVKDPNSLEAVAKRSTGKRGPYDVFTGPRDASTIKGYFSTDKSTDAGDWPKSFPGEMEKLLHKSKYFKGRWTTCPRFPKSPGLRIMLKDLALCYKDPRQPGPGHYDPKSPRKPKNRKNYPFDMNVEFVRPIVMTHIQPGPGRYNVKNTRTIPGHGWTFVFKSKAPRTKFIVIPKYNAF